MTRPFVLSPSQQEHNVGQAPGYLESSEMRKVCMAASKHLNDDYGIGNVVVPDFTALNEPYDFQKAVAWSNARNASGHLAVHSNAGGSTKGTVTFWGRAEGKRLAECVQAAVAPVSPGADIGVLFQAAHWAELYSVKAPSALVEIEFHDWAKGALSIAQHYDLYGQALADGVAAWLGVKPKVKISPSVARIRKEIIALHGTPDQAYLEKYVMRWVQKGH
ncbi:MAG: N-acetylmuramoyl-L-alanine amidase [Kiritimatiellae bacterium]|nr:N-acetylmuramoyl-L-alanine amidase [Kiritimatiellia bacterium]